MKLPWWDNKKHSVESSPSFNKTSDTFVMKCKDLLKFTVAYDQVKIPIVKFPMKNPVQRPVRRVCLPVCLDNWVKLWQCPLVWMASDGDFTAALLLVKRAPLNLLFLSHMTLTTPVSFCLWIRRRCYNLMMTFLYEVRNVGVAFYISTTNIIGKLVRSK